LKPRWRVCCPRLIPNKRKEVEMDIAVIIIAVAQAVAWVVSEITKKK
jgi:hypothetical protein